MHVSGEEEEEEVEEEEEEEEETIQPPPPPPLGLAPQEKARGYIPIDSGKLEKEEEDI